MGLNCLMYYGCISYGYISFFLLKAVFFLSKEPITVFLKAISNLKRGFLKLLNIVKKKH